MNIPFRLFRVSIGKISDQLSLAGSSLSTGSSRCPLGLLDPSRSWGIENMVRINASIDLHRLGPAAERFVVPTRRAPPEANVVDGQSTKFSPLSSLRITISLAPHGFPPSSGCGSRSGFQTPSQPVGEFDGQGLCCEEPSVATLPAEAHRHRQWRDENSSN